ncbi:hypothetical protein BpHYR1_026845 [Brachionus plicatilis]|uniref:Uncharacterized protein n=1 Tax=Brachionus plicatilis TaxID=10195 RepID=A0A3M7S7F7_BRAPC|nr:hypothetical protein BpHYR1_026845 [Brachionus plicatilis]
MAGLVHKRKPLMPYIFEQFIFIFKLLNCIRCYFNCTNQTKTGGHSGRLKIIKNFAFILGLNEYNILLIEK